MRLRDVHKGRPQSEEEGVASSDILRTRGRGCSSDVDVRNFRCKTHRTFGNLWYVRTTRGREGWATSDILRTKEERLIFREFVRTSFMEGL